MPETGAALFATFYVSDELTLSAAATASHLRPSANLKGLIDALARLNKGQVKIGGWAVDLGEPGTPVTVIVFVNGKSVFETQTIGARPDLATTLKISDIAASNAAFEGVLSCTPNQQLFVVAVTKKDFYTSLAPVSNPLVCPS
jgi:hypothetical protein